MNGLLPTFWNHFESFLLVLMRVSILLLFFPLWDSRMVPSHIKVFSAFTLALVLTPVVQGSLPPFPRNIPAGGLMLLQELLLGLVIFLCVRFVFAGMQLAGEMLGIQMGFGMVTMIDPTAEGQASLLASLVYWLALLSFLALGGHHFLLRILVESFTALPPGWRLPELGALPEVIIPLGGTIFTLGVQVLAPVVAVIFLMQVMLGLVARTVTQIQVMLISFPLTILLGLFFLAATLPFLAPLLDRQFQGLAASVEKVVRMLQG